MVADNHIRGKVFIEDYPKIFWWNFAIFLFIYAYFGFGFDKDPQSCFAPID